MRITVKHDINISLIKIYLLILTVTVLIIGYFELKQAEKLKVLELENKQLQEKVKTAEEITRLEHPVITDDLLNSLFFVESSMNPNAYNESSGAVGLGQLTKIIYNDFCNMTKEEAFDQIKNKHCSKLYLIHLYNKYKGNLSKALRHYNAGTLPTTDKYVNKVLNNKVMLAQTEQK
jgi:hypothetical protein